VSDPGDLEIYEEERVEAPDHRHVWSRSSSGQTKICDVVDCGVVRWLANVDHVLCPNCAHEGRYLCGISRDDEHGPVLSLSDSFIGTPCAVCFSSPTLTCNRCGTEIMTCP